MTTPTPFDAVLFDLDGTLIDTAPDMVSALNVLRAEHELDALPYEALRRDVSQGAAVLVERGFGHLSSAERRRLVERYLDIYFEALAVESRLFDGLGKLLARLDLASTPWGIVTNKPAYLTHALLEALGLDGRAQAVVCGDTLSERKPHPMPLLHAASMLDRLAHHCVYVGDSRRDIEAGRAAGMETVAVAYGYIPDGDAASSWEADYVVDDPSALYSFFDARLRAPDTLADAD